VQRGGMSLMANAPQGRLNGVLGPAMRSLSSGTNVHKDWFKVNLSVGIDLTRSTALTVGLHG